ncbi:hypothetical protein BH10BAC4_BH10BAC4_22860 [soil metagenome]
MKSIHRNEPRYDQEIVDYARTNNINYFVMNFVCTSDYKHFSISTEDYDKRYFIGRYSPAGNLLSPLRFRLWRGWIQNPFISKYI